MRTVLHVLGTAQPEFTGIAKIVVAASHALATAGYRTRAVFLRGDGPLIGRLAEAGIPAERVDWGGARDLAGDWRVWRYFRRLRPDMLHQHFGGEYLRAVARAAGVRRIVAHFHDHGQEVDRGRARAHSTLFTDAVIATSRSVADMISGCVVDVVYPCIVPVSAAPPAALAGRLSVIGAVSRLAPVKGHIHLVRAMPAILARVPEARLEIVGEGPERPRLEAEIARLGLTGKVALPGWQDDLDSCLKRWRCVAHPSLIEGFGISLLEAAMRGLPIVASRTGGIPELIEEGVGGLLVPPEDPAALAAALTAILVDAPYASRLGAAAAQRAQTVFAPEAFAAGLRAVYARL